MRVPEIGLDTMLSRSEIEGLFESLLKRLVEVSSTLLSHCTRHKLGLLTTAFHCTAFEAGSCYGFY